MGLKTKQLNKGGTLGICSRCFGRCASTIFYQGQLPAASHHLSGVATVGGAGTRGMWQVMWAQKEPLGAFR